MSFLTSIIMSEFLIAWTLLTHVFTAPQFKLKFYISCEIQCTWKGLDAYFFSLHVFQRLLLLFPLHSPQNGNILYFSVVVATSF